MANLYDTLAAGFPAEPCHPFAFTTDGDTFDYRWVAARSAAFAAVLASLGVTPGSRVAVQADKSLAMLMLYLGGLRAGAVFVPLNPAYTAAEVGWFLRDAEPALFVCARERRGELEAVARAAGVPRVEDLDSAGGGSLAALADAAPGSFATMPRADDDCAAILYTSGTTGRPKGAMLSHANLAANAATLTRLWCFTADDVLLHALPIFHTHGLFVASHSVLMAGASMIFLPRFEAREVIAQLPRATVMMGVPTFYTRLLAEPGLTRESAAHMRLFISGSAPLSPEHARAFTARTGHAILERYGMTETNMLTSNPHDGERLPGSVGMPLPDVSLRIADPESGAVLAPGEVGVIEVAGPGVFSGYWRLPGKTAEDFRNGHFITGDLGRIDASGYVHIVGRARDLIISGGLNIYPAEVEAGLDALPEVAESAVIGAPHGDLGEAVVAVIVPRDAGFADAGALIAGLGGTLARFKQPRRVVFITELPRNAMGKVRKAALREAYAGVFE